MHDYEHMTYWQLLPLMEHPGEDAALVAAFSRRALIEGGDLGKEQAHDSLVQYSSLLIDHGNVFAVADLVHKISPEPGEIESFRLLHLVTRLEAAGAEGLAVQVLEFIYDNDPQNPDTEPALMRLGHLFETAFADIPQARDAYRRLLQHFPNGELSIDAQIALQRLGEH